MVERTSKDRPDLLIEYRYLDALSKPAGDPEVSLGAFAVGVRLGPRVRMPRLPALYAKKRRWRLPDPVAWLEEQAAVQGVWRQNYSSLTEWSEECKNIMDDQVEREQVLRVGEVETRRRFPGLTVASPGAQRKEKSRGDVTARIPFDGTHGIDVKTRIRIRDQESAPIAADVKRFLREKSNVETPTFGLTADISKTHNQVPIDPRDWHFLGCQIAPGSDVYVHYVGTFGIASASYCWSRVSTGRLAQYLVGHRAQTWHLFFADDYHLDGGGQSYRQALVVFFVLCTVVGVPFDQA